MFFGTSSRIFERVGKSKKRDAERASFWVAGGMQPCQSGHSTVRIKIPNFFFPTDACAHGKDGHSQRSTPPPFNPGSPVSPQRQKH